MSRVATVAVAVAVAALRRALPILLTSVASLAAGPVSASAALAEQHGCSNCHVADKKLVGPAHKAGADRYRGQPDATARMVAKVAQDGAGVWGAVPMPAMAHVPAEDASALMAWILAQ